MAEVSIRLLSKSYILLRGVAVIETGQEFYSFVEVRKKQKIKLSLR
jgi:hypothetical protein